MSNRRATGRAPPRVAPRGVCYRTAAKMAARRPIRAALRLRIRHRLRYGATMIYVHEVHDVRGGKMPEFADAVRTEWRPLVEESGDARLMWFWELTHGTGPSYQA